MFSLSRLFGNASEKPYHGPLFFLHMPKTGGTSIFKILDLHYSENEILPAWVIPELKDFEDKDFASRLLFRGHFTFNLRHRLPEGTRIFTFLREPVARSISYLKYIRFRKNMWLHQMEDISEMTVNDMIQRPLVQQAIRDAQLRRLALDMDYQLPHMPLQLQEPQQLNESHLALGKERLSECMFVGLTEQMESSVKALCKLLNWDISGQDIPFENKGSALPGFDEELTPETIAIIQECTQLDQQLYAHAHQLFQRSVMGSA